MQGRFKYGKLSKYPHMKPEDVAIWERFLLDYPEYFDTVDYDVSVGVGRMPNELTGDNVEKGWKDLTSKKIDVVGYKNNTITLIEVKPNARANALGQIWMYDELFKDQFENVGEIKNLIITDDIDPDTLRVANSGNVDISNVS